jgi:hypothetical protein
MASEDAVAQDYSGGDQPPVMSDLVAQANEIYDNPELSFNQKAAALDSVLAQANAINPVSNTMSGEQYLLNMDAQNRGETTSGPYNGPGFGNFTGFTLGDYEGPTSTYDLPVLSGKDEVNATPEQLRNSDAERASAGQSSNADGGGNDQSNDYYSDLINQMAGDDRSNQTKGNQYAANVGNTATDAQDFGTVNIFEEPPIKDETFNKLDEQNENSSNVLNAVGEGLDAYLADASKASDSRTVPIPANSGMAAVEDGARVAASRGLLQQYLDSNPSYPLSIGRDIMPQLQATDRAAQTRIATGGATLTRPVVAQTATSTGQSQPDTVSVIDSIIGAADAAGKTLSSSFGSVVDAGKSVGSAVGDVASGIVDAGKSLFSGSGQVANGQTGGGQVGGNGSGQVGGNGSGQVANGQTGGNGQSDSGQGNSVVGSIVGGLVDAGKSVGSAVGNVVDAGKNLVTGTETQTTDKNTNSDTSGLPFGTGTPINIDPELTYNTPSETTATTATTAATPYNFTPYGFASANRRKGYGLTDYIQSDAALKTVAPVDFSKYNFPTQPQTVTANQSVQDVYPLFNTPT